jgi:hypothetical protein
MQPILEIQIRIANFLVSSWKLALYRKDFFYET